MRPIFVAAAAAALAGCSTDRVATELQDVETLAQASSAEIQRQLVPALERERQEALTEAARNGDVWLLDASCDTVLSLDARVALEECQIVKARTGGGTPPVGDATAAIRKMSVVTAYITALRALSDATLETDITTAYGAALAALGEFATVTRAERLQAFLAEREERKETADAVLSDAISALRFQRLKSVVLASDGAVEELVREIQQHLLNSGLAPGVTQRVARLRQANTDVLSVDRADPVAYRAALVELETAHADFIDHYQKSIVYDVVLIGAAHRALARAVSSPGAPEEIAAYINTLAETFEKVKDLN